MYGSLAAQNNQVVTNGHVSYCHKHGHATWRVNGTPNGLCARCGKVLAGAASSTVPATPAAARKAAQLATRLNQGSRHKYGTVHVYATGSTVHVHFADSYAGSRSSYPVSTPIATMQARALNACQAANLAKSQQAYVERQQANQQAYQAYQAQQAQQAAAQQQAQQASPAQQQQAAAANGGKLPQAMRTTHAQNNAQQAAAQQQASQGQPQAQQASQGQPQAQQASQGQPQARQQGMHATAALTQAQLNAEISAVFAAGPQGPRFCSAPYVAGAVCLRAGNHQGQHVTQGFSRLVGWPQA